MPEQPFQGLAVSENDESLTEARSDGCGNLILVLTGHMYLSWMLLFIPFGFLSHWLMWPEWLIFTCNFFSILPMAWLIGKSTEDIAEHMGDIVGGLLNATFGNIVEMLLCVAGIRQNQLSVVKCTLVGSILSNLLLVMGTAFMWGGYWYKTQKYSKIGAGAQSSLMLLSVLGVLLPTTYNMLVPGQEAILKISRGCSVLLLLVYVQYLVFQLKTHADLFEPEKQEVLKAKKTSLGSVGRVSVVSQADEDDEESEDDEIKLFLPVGVAVLGVCTILTVACTEYLVQSLEGFIEGVHVSKEFVGIIILPIIGNAAEHYTAIIVAGRNKMDLSLGVAVGSSCQMALLVTPFTVLFGWYLDKPMSLNFQPFKVMVLLLSVLIVGNVLKDGESNWLEGSMLVTAYVTIATIYLFESEDQIADSLT